MPKRKKSGGSQQARVKITLVKSTIGFDRKQDRVVTGLGLRRIGHTVDVKDTPQARGMVHRVRHLVKIDD